MSTPDRSLVARSPRPRSTITPRAPRWAGWLLPLALVACGGPEEEEVTITDEPMHGDVSLTGSEFEIDTDANLSRNHAPPSLDWATVAENRQADQPTGAGDDSFGQGTKEDTAVPTVVDGSIPPNKSDLLNFGVYLEENANGKFLHLFWHRVQEPTARRTWTSSSTSPRRRPATASRRSARRATS